ncbi:MAG: DNA polymerase III subunit gamma/tau [Alphaproteobacteria bacterium]|nr:DNA polymerase III subunit gamma/tau [Alphaproteobacteria bacterium]
MSDAAPAYRVLARKYRPSRFADMIGQEALVRTLSNAMAAGRLAHAFVLTGVRGVGKTTTARIIARALNCVGPDGKGGPTIDPCGVCTHCVQIAEDRHMDVIEMDAASRTGVDDIRELIDGVRYRPVAARFKVYIVDEVHMLSKNAFNALLKTLEEPPEHVKFVFATTEIGKVPITVLSRCQRFDLRRIDQAMLAGYLAEIATREGRTVEPGAAVLLARAADGSARDGLSLLDRALAHVDGAVGEAAVRDMLGLADRTRIFDLFELVMKGDTAASLTAIAALYQDGADPGTVLADLLELVHWLTRLKAVPGLADDPTVPEAERNRGRTLAATLSIPVLARAWQMLLKGVGESQSAPNPLAALEMLIIRLAHAAELPTPAELVARLGNAPTGGGPSGGGRPAAPNGGTIPGATIPGTTMSAPPPGAPVAQAPQAGGRSGIQALRAEPVTAEAPQPDGAPQAAAAPAELADFAAVVALCAARREGMLHAHLRADVHLVRYEPGRIEWRTTPSAPRDLASRLIERLQQWTGQRWMVTVSQEAGAPTIAEQEDAQRRQRTAAAAAHPLVRAVLDAFPGATIEAVRGAFAPAATGGGSDDGDEAAPAAADATGEPVGESEGEDEA